MGIEVVNRQRLARIDALRVASLVEKTLAATDKAGRTLSVVFIRDLAMQNLNRKFRARNETTDVLAFPLEYDPRIVGEDSLRDRFVARYLGEVVVSTDTALSQATEAGHSFDREVDELVIHGVLHLCGYDHETDSGQMNRLELKLRKKLLDGSKVHGRKSKVQTGKPRGL